MSRGLRVATTQCYSQVGTGPSNGRLPESRESLDRHYGSERMRRSRWLADDPLQSGGSVQLIDDEPSASTPAPVGAGRQATRSVVKGGRRSSGVLTALSALILAGLGWLLLGTDSAADDGAGGPSDVAERADDSSAGDGAGADLDRLAAIPQALGGPTPTVRWETPPKFGGRAGAALPAEVAAARQLVLIDPERGAEVVSLDGSLRRSLPVEPTVSGGLAVLGDRVVYRQNGQALAVSLVGEESAPLGPADLILPSRSPDRVWLGQLVIEANRPDTFAWREVDRTGTVQRVSVRVMPLDFPSPALASGTSDTVWRLVAGDDLQREWRLLSPGVAIAAGLNDVIVRRCDGVRCARVWFDAGTGKSTSPVLDDVAERLPIERFGLLSPDGRFVVEDRPDDGVIVHAVTTGEAITRDCISVDRLAWSSDPALLACRTTMGISVFGLDTGGRSDLSGASDATRFVLVDLGPRLVPGLPVTGSSTR